MFLAFVIQEYCIQLSAVVAGFIMCLTAISSWKCSEILHMSSTFEQTQIHVIIYGLLVMVVGSAGCISSAFVANCTINLLLTSGMMLSYAGLSAVMLSVVYKQPTPLLNLVVDNVIIQE